MLAVKQSKFSKPSSCIQFISTDGTHAADCVHNDYVYIHKMLKVAVTKCFFVLDKWLKC